MSQLVRLIDITKDFGETQVLKNATLKLQLGEHVGLVGHNGAGKTTLVNILTGDVKQDHGQVLWDQKRTRIGYLKQSTHYTPAMLEAIFNSSKESINRFFKNASYLHLEDVINWSKDRFEGLSGGEKLKVVLASILSIQPQLLILDEPTNHLDFKGIQWLTQELNRFEGTVFVISHDRYFLDQTVARILELDNGIIHSYKGNYTQYYEIKKHLYESQMSAFVNQEKCKREIQREISNLKNWSKKAHEGAVKKASKSGLRSGKEYYRNKAKKKDNVIKSRLKRLEKIDHEGVQKPTSDKPIHFDLSATDKHGKRILEAQNISKSFHDHMVFEDSSFYICQGERIGLFGDNGSGKTTFMRMVMNTLAPDNGSLFISPSAKIAYMSQDVSDLDGDSCLMDHFETPNRETQIRIQNRLWEMGFNQSLLRQKIKHMSLGEQTRAKLARIAASDYNVLLLDEPTNHLDLKSREQLEHTLKQFKGTLIIATHDRYMLERLCDHLLVFESKAIQRSEYNLIEYLEKASHSNGHHAENDLMMVENKLAEVLGKLSLCSRDSAAYQQLDQRFQELLARKKELTP